jgi:hypothetical protein
MEITSLADTIGALTPNTVCGQSLLLKQNHLRVCHCVGICQGLLLPLLDVPNAEKRQNTARQSTKETGTAIMDLADDHPVLFRVTCDSGTSDS